MSVLGCIGGMVHDRILCVTVLTTWTLFLFTPCCGQASLRTFPRLFNVAQNKPVYTQPSQSTCGVATRGTFCKSTPDLSSIIRCELEPCVQDCPSRTTMPLSVDLLRASGFGACVITDAVNLRPGSSERSRSSFFGTGALCYLTPLQHPTLGTNAAFTVAFWFWMETRSMSTIVEKFSTTRETLFKIQVGPSTVELLYKSRVGLSEVVFSAVFAYRTWSHVAIQVYDNTVSCFINGTSYRLAPSDTRTLLGTVQDDTGTFRLGQSNNGADQFVGRLQDVYFFSQALTNREIDYLYSGTLPSVRTQTECRCPVTHPRVRDDNSHLCIRNSARLDTADEILRLNNESHPLQYINDGDINSFWVSDSSNPITLEVNLGDQFQVFYVVLQFYSPGPKDVTVERQVVADGPWLRWQTYADDCMSVFGLENNGPLPDATSVNCLQFNTNNLLVPYSKGNITFSVLSSSPVARPGYNDFYNSPELKDFVKATKLKVRLNGHYYVTDPKHFYFGVFEFIITGRCNCQGHAETCDTSTPVYTCQCSPESNTEGNKCERCKPLFNDKPFREGTPTEANACVACECHNHADVCVYDSAQNGGVCMNCRHNTTGRQCGTCIDFFFRPEGTSMDADDVCRPCDCIGPGILDANRRDCEKVGGQCTCKKYVSGRQCDQCSQGYYNLQSSNVDGCQPCDCDTDGTVAGDTTCHQSSGDCNCKANVRGRACSSCEHGYFNMSAAHSTGCIPCGCHPRGAVDRYCNPAGGQCVCRDNVIGRQCDECADGFTDFDSDCPSCDCNIVGTEPGTTCNKSTGQCVCKQNVMGLKCDTCSDGYFRLGSNPVLGCQSCACEPAGIEPGSNICNKITGDCECKENVQGRSCNQCKPNTFNLRRSNAEGCEDCDCDPSGTLNGDQLAPHGLTCDQNTGQCTCLTNREGRRCDACTVGFFVNSAAGGGCEPCNCHADSTVPGTVCDTVTGQCQCSLPGSTGRRCDLCGDRYYGYIPTEGSCKACDCDPRGSKNYTCHVTSGQCDCKRLTAGRTCSECVENASNLQGDNPDGCSAAPSQQPPPQHVPISPTSLRIYWMPPDHPNGFINSYTLFRNGSQIALLSSETQSYNDTGPLLPFSYYSYEVVASNSAGSARSPPAVFRTPPSVPSGALDLAVTSVLSRSAIFSWNKPASPNGVIQSYNLTSVTVLDTTSRVTHYAGLSLTVTLNDLEPYMIYLFRIEACTEAGCLKSSDVNIQTLQAVPEGQGSPDIQALSSTQLYVEWDPPQKPNGIIIFYELWMRGMMGDDGQFSPPPSRIFHPAGQYNPLPASNTLPPPATNFTITDLEPYYPYEFQVLSENGLGKAASDWTTSRTLPDVPLMMPPPVITALSSTEVNVTWTEPDETLELRGSVQQYSVYHYFPNDLILSPHAPPYEWKVLLSSTRHLVVTGLKPFSNVTFLVEACNPVGCINSSTASVLTFVDAPGNINPPTVIAVNMSTLQISWSPPRNVNGPLPSYTVRRRETSLNYPPPNVERGTRFARESYYLFPPETIPQGVGFTGIELSFKTRQEDGLLMFAASPGRQEEFIAVQLNNGRPWFLFDPQGCTSFVQPFFPNETTSFDDGSWHNLLIKRNLLQSFISVDDTFTGCFTEVSASSDGSPDLTEHWHTISAYRNTTFSQIVFNSKLTGCEGFNFFVTTINDEGRPYRDGKWHKLTVRRNHLQASVVIDRFGSGCMSMTTTTNDEGLGYDNGKWHTLRAKRLESQSSLVLDGRWTGEKTATCASGNIIGSNTGVYVGGAPRDFIIQRAETDSRAQIVEQGFIGCVKDIKILVQETPEEIWVPLNWSSAISTHMVSPSWAGCPLNLDNDNKYHFLGTGYAQVKGGLPVKIADEVVYMTFQIRTENPDGVLMFAYGFPSSYFLVEIVDGHLRAMFSNGATLEEVTYNKTVCDGRTHFILVHKSNAQIALEVDSEGKVAEGDNSSPAQLELSSDLFLGGVPSDAGSLIQRFIKENSLAMQRSFGGCMFEIYIHRSALDVKANSRKFVDVYLDGCPKTSVRSCYASTADVVYEGFNTVAYDHDLQSFTEYSYNVEVRNEVGFNTSDWVVGRTSEGPPNGVSPPYDIVALSGYNVSVKWNKAEGQTGKLTVYRLLADNLEDGSQSPVVNEFSAESTVQRFTGQLTGLTPFTNYSVSLEACTAGGCTQSEPGGNVLTLQEKPEGVRPPVAIDRGADYIVVGWQEPEYTNGIVTGYLLYWEQSLVYTGAELTFTMQNLIVYTGYRVQLEVCTQIGCTRSDEVVLSTSQLPPSQMDPPVLAVMGTTSISVSWVPPDSLNGDFRGYVLYVSEVEDEVGSVGYNSTDLFISYVLTGLTPGSTYWISVAACSGGGCSRSNGSMASTEESAPSGVLEPVVTSPSPSQLNVTWQEPLSPNGDIIQYWLYLNGLRIFNTSFDTSYMIDQLQPWSLHFVRVEACTQQGCASSQEVPARTAEAPPVGTVGLEVGSITARSAEIRFTGIQLPNGMVYYNVIFTGLFYVDPVMWDYSTVTEARSLHQTQTPPGDNEWVVINGLLPHASYEVLVNASNSAGYVVSHVEDVNTPMGAPDGVAPPTLTTTTPTSVRAVWQAALRANADLEPAYQLQFKDTPASDQVQNLFALPTTSTTFLKTNLRPYAAYEFRVVAINIYGQTLSDWAQITTKQDRPSSIDPPMTQNLQSRSVTLVWNAPLQPNGVITEYRIYIGANLAHKVGGNITQWLIDGLLPFTRYIFSVEACTIAGCTSSLPSLPVTTPEAGPEGIAPPTLTSLTPTSVRIIWTPPTSPNGVIIQYALERRLRATPSAVTLVQVFLPSASLVYEDDEASIEPATQYDYRVMAQNGAGKGYSPWASVTTRPSRPGGVKQPVVSVLGSTSIEVTWQPPIKVNGRMERYIIKLPVPRFELTNTSVTHLVINDLIPFTQYNVTVTACSDGGCTESSAATAMTSPSVPENQAPPIATPHSQTYVSVLWQPPRRPNGPNLRYELARKKIRQPLQVGYSGFDVWTSVFVGTAQYYEDRALSIFTTYQYRITAYNDYGHTISEASDEVTTFGGIPLRPAELFVQTRNHTSLDISWITPNVTELQGEVIEYKVNLTDVTAATQLSISQPGGTSMMTASNLKPSTLYKVSLTMMMHGGASITSSPVNITTLEGAPEGFPDPVILSINDTALRVAWLEPDSPNGRVTGYSLYVDTQPISLNTSLPGSVVLGGLEPYRIYNIQMEVCTQYDCLRSRTVKAATAESLPVGLAPPRLIVQGAMSLSVLWQAPSRPNGIIIRYELVRREVISCSDRPTPTQSTPVGACMYLECGILESFCGHQCYTGPKTCCQGVLHNNTAGYECCGRNYVPRRSHSSYICCGGRFHQPLPHHTCCGDRYVEVAVGQVCCEDPDEDRVVVGPGDTCCSSVPFSSSSGSQVCCQGVLYDGFEQHCCGGELVSRTFTCCGDGTHGMPHLTDERYTCCGTHYADMSISSCCTDQLGVSKVHIYSSTEAKAAANEKCCGAERISAGLSCCNGVGFSPVLQACADTSIMSSGCGTGTVCDIAGQTTAFCDKCDFDRNTRKCGSFIAHQISSFSMDDNEIMTDPEKCFSDPVKVYTGDDRGFLDSGLSPFTEYHYTVTATNGAGTAMSDTASISTAESAPAGLDVPEAKTQPERLDIITLNWKPPSQPNGIILWYALRRDGVEIFRHPSQLTYTDNNAIQPYNTYTYQLSVCNVAGCTTTPEIRVATLQAKPEQVYPPSITVESSSSLLLVWSPPGRPNGNLEGYNIYESTLGHIINISASARQYSLTGLQSYTVYTFLLSACTEAGCTNSSTNSARTSPDVPQGLDLPLFVIVSSHTLEVYWQPPDKANGIISGYRLYRSLTSDRIYSLVDTFSNETLNTTDGPLAPTMQYRYLVEVFASGGAVNSTEARVTMPATTPVQIPPPYNVTALDAKQLFVAWTQPGLSNGIIDQYRVILNAGSSSESEHGAGDQLNATISGLSPYTLYSVRIRACLEGIPYGCGTGPGVTVRTLQAPPEGLNPPHLVATSSEIINVSWSAPSNPNGIITQYRIHRRLVANPNIDLQGILVEVLSGDVFSFLNVGPELEPYTEYDYRITAVNIEGETTSSWSRVRTLQAIPETLRAPVVSFRGAYAVGLTWQPPEKPNGLISVYWIEYQVSSSDASQQTVLLYVRVTGDVLSSSLSGLQPYTPYDLRIKAVNDAGSVTSQWTRTTTEQAPPSGISPFTVEKILDGQSVILKWSEPTQPNGVINNYLVYEADNINAVYQGITREFEYRRLSPYTQYIILLEACTNAGCTRSTKQSFYTAEIPPENQEMPSAGEVNDTHVTLMWSRPVNAYGRILSYDILRRKDSLRKKRALSEPVVIHTLQDDGSDQFSYTDTNVEPYTVYEYSIKSRNSQGSTQSPWLSLTTAQAPPSGLPSPIVSHVTGRPDQLRIRWTSPSQANGIIQYYQLKRNSTTIETLVPSDPKEYLDTGLQAHTVYAYVITVCTEPGCTSSSPTVIRTSETAPYFVNPPTVEALNSTAIKVSWTEPDLTNGFLLEYRLKVNGATVYSGLDVSYVVGGLVPYQPYIFLIEACTHGGCTASQGITGRPHEAPPNGQNAPTLRVINSHAIEISWSAPQQPNGIITTYEVRRDGKLIDMTSGFIITDNEVQPGQTYSYTVTAVNSQGSTTSPSMSATTYGSSPSGLDPPILEALSSNSVRATWKPPSSPNGQILNYTLYKNQTDIAYSNTGFSTDINFLDPFTVYSFRVEACTSQGCALSDPSVVTTLEAPPVGLGMPSLTALADSTGAHSGVLITWSPPFKPNGHILHYDVHRRNFTGLSVGVSSIATLLLYSGTGLQHEDADPALLPFTYYEYRVTAVNSVGQVNSGWLAVQTAEAPPQGVKAPIVTLVTETSIRLELLEPDKTNGNIESYQIFSNGELVMQSRSTEVNLVSLTPYTRYTLYMVACTAGGCTAGPTVDAVTLSSQPDSITPPVIGNVTSNRFSVTWNPPQTPNGEIERYVLVIRQSCPHPYADANDNVDIPCEEGEWREVINDLVLEAQVDNLKPFTLYEIQLNAFNARGGLRNPPSVLNHTLPASPEYITSSPPKVQPIGNVVTVNWVDSFNVNGEVEQFVLFKNGEVEYTGMATSYNVFRTSRTQTFEFQVKLVTSEGEAITPTLIFDPTQPGFIVTEAPVTSEPSGDGDTLPVYHEDWFIAVVVILALLLLFISVIVCIRCTSSRRDRVPYIRERSPLQRKEQQMGKSGIMQPYDRRSGTTETPIQYTGNVDRGPPLPNVGYINPAYSQLSMQNDMPFMEFDGYPQKWPDDGSDWDGPIPYGGTDSGLHSLAYGDDYDTASDHPISILKEHTMFTDTHL